MYDGDRPLLAQPLVENGTNGTKDKTSFVYTPGRPPKDEDNGVVYYYIYLTFLNSFLVTLFCLQHSHYSELFLSSSVVKKLKIYDEDRPLLGQSLLEVGTNRTKDKTSFFIYPWKAPKDADNGVVYYYIYLMHLNSFLVTLFYLQLSHYSE